MLGKQKKRKGAHLSMFAWAGTGDINSVAETAEVFRTPSATSLREVTSFKPWTMWGGASALSSWSRAEKTVEWAGAYVCICPSAGELMVGTQERKILAEEKHVLEFHNLSPPDWQDKAGESLCRSLCWLSPAKSAEERKTTGMLGKMKSRQRQILFS